MIKNDQEFSLATQDSEYSSVATLRKN